MRTLCSKEADVQKGSRCQAIESLFFGSRVCLSPPVEKQKNANTYIEKSTTKSYQRNRVNSCDEVDGKAWTRALEQALTPGFKISGESRKGN